MAARPVGEWGLSTRRSGREGVRLQERHQVGASEAALPPATDAEAGEATRVGPAAQRRFADLEQRRRLLDVEQLRFACHRAPSCCMLMLYIKVYKSIENDK